MHRTTDAKTLSSIKELLDRGWTPKKVAEHLRLNPSTVYAWRRLLRLGRNEIEDAARALIEGEKPIDVARSFGCGIRMLDIILKTRIGMTSKEIRQLDTTYFRATVSSDPRSRACQTVERCAHTTCHMHRKCPSYANFVAWQQQGRR